jgi:hypothetical protein
MFDNIAHKPGANALIDKAYLTHAVELLNKLLPIIRCPAEFSGGHFSYYFDAGYSGTGEAKKSGLRPCNEARPKS